MSTHDHESQQTFQCMEIWGGIEPAKRIVSTPGGDLICFYTDALTEATDSAGKLLGESGLLEAAGGLDLSDPRPGTIGPALLDAVARYSRHRAPKTTSP